MALVVLGLLGTACSGLRRSKVGPPDAERPFLLSPAFGWSQPLAPERATWLASQYRDLMTRDEGLSVLNEATEVLARDPHFHPARVLDAQVRFLSGRYTYVVDALAPVRTAVPDYVAAEVLAGRAFENLDRPLEAFRAYWSVRQRSPIAAERVAALEETAVGRLADRFESELDEGLEAEAAASLEELRAFAPTHQRTIAAESMLAAAISDPMTRLALLRRQGEQPDADPEVIRRLAELELEVGDAATAVRLAEGLTERLPGDRGLVELLQRARFQWRLEVLPADVGALSRRSELSRADYAVLLYWLFPNVRYSRPEQGRIASDIIDHPDRERIVRVINMGLLEVDPAVHRFEPDAPVRRGEVLRALLELADESSEAACRVGAADGGSSDALCVAAERCRLLPSAAECEPWSTVSGTEALELIRRTLAGLDEAV